MTLLAPAAEPRRGARLPRAVPLAVLAALVPLAVLAALGIGAVPIAPADLLALVAARGGWGTATWADASRQDAVLFAIRLPRALFGALAGATLAGGGAAVQALFRNPLADPALIGTAAGAALGAATAVVALTPAPAWAPDWLRLAALPAAAFLGGLAATAAVYGIANRDGRTAPATLLLAGIAVNALAGAGTGLLAFAANDAQLRSLTFWTLGSLGSVTWQGLGIAAPLLVASLLGLLASARPLNLLLLGEREARHLGIDVERLQRRTVLLMALGVGAAVALSGVIAFVGLVVPHLVRLAGGPDHRVVIPGSMALGAALLVGADVAARTAVAPAELPLGVVTALVGAPFFLFLLRRARVEE
ncbi:iron ABC transporter permease [bacterium]|nr:iron ABC transporter permease [bacterium]